MNKNKKQSLLLALVILIILFGSLAALFYQQTQKTSAKTALVYQNDVLLREIDLTNVPEPYTFTVEWNDGEYNTILVEPGQIGIIDTNCPDEICQHMGMVSTTAYPISCLPHKLLIKITSTERTPDNLDAIVR